MRSGNYPPLCSTQHTRVRSPPSSLVDREARPSSTGNTNRKVIEMSDKSQTKRAARIRRHGRVRRKVIGTAERQRLAVFRSNRHIEVQVIDDVLGQTLAALSTRENGYAGASGGNRDVATEVGKLISDRTTAATLNSVRFYNDNTK